MLFLYLDNLYSRRADINTKDARAFTCKDRTDFIQKTHGKSIARKTKTGLVRQVFVVCLACSLDVRIPRSARMSANQIVWKRQSLEKFLERKTDSCWMTCSRW